METPGNNLESTMEQEEIIGGKEIWDKLATAFGGFSQVPDSTVGMAIAGHMNNGALSAKSIEEIKTEIDGVVDAICERWEDQGPNPEEVRAEIIKGMKEQAKDWGKENVVWKFLQAIESGK